MDKFHLSTEKSCCSPVSSAFPALILRAEIAEFDRLRTWLQNIAQQLKLPEELTSRLLIAADEVFTNISAYAYPGTTGQVEVSAEQAGAELRLIFKDAGKPFDPLQTEDPDTGIPLSERKIGGLGIFVVKKLMDKVEYRRENGRNILILTKRMTPEVPPC